MKRALLSGLLVMANGITPLLAQENIEDLLENPRDFLPEVPALPHLKVLKGYDDPDAIPIHVAALLMLNGRYGREFDGALPAVDRFAEHYAADWALAEAMVPAIRQVFSEREVNRLAQRRAFCARSFSSASSWKAALIAIDTDNASAQVGAFNRLRAIAGAQVWEQIILEAYEARRNITIVREDYDSVAAELGYQTAFSNQCRDVSGE